MRYSLETHVIEDLLSVDQQGNVSSLMMPTSLQFYNTLVENGMNSIMYHDFNVLDVEIDINGTYYLTVMSIIQNEALSNDEE